MSRRRDSRVALSSFRHHSDLGIYEDVDGKVRPILFIDQQQVELQGEYGEVVFQEDMVEVLKLELPEHDTGRSKLIDQETGQVWLLGREIKDDGHIRTIEVSKE